MPPGLNLGDTMLTQEQRATMSAMWLARWHGWQRSGVSMAEYARREGFDADAAYRWRRVLRRTGQWVETEGAPAVSKSPSVKKRRQAVRFARVVVSDPPPATSMLLRVVLMNGRRAELEIGCIAQLGEVIGVLERAA
jgi:transposase-like protein